MHLEAPGNRNIAVTASYTLGSDHTTGPVLRTVVTFIVYVLQNIAISIGLTHFIQMNFPDNTYASIDSPSSIPRCFAITMLSQIFIVISFAQVACTS